MTTYDYIETRPSLPHGRNTSQLITAAFLALSFILGFAVSETTEKRSSYVSPSVYYSTAGTIEDWHGNVMRSQPQLLEIN